MSYTHSKQYVCMCHDCGNDIAQYVSQSVFHVTVRGPSKAFFLVSPGCPNNQTCDNTPLLLRLLLCFCAHISISVLSLEDEALF